MQSTTQRTMPTLAAVPSQRATQGTTKRPKRPNVLNEAQATVRVHKNSDKVTRITNQQTDVEYTIYTYQVNINQLTEYNVYVYLRLKLSAMHFKLLFFFASNIHLRIF